MTSGGPGVTGRGASVLIMGVSGSGKSVLAAALAERLGFEFLEGDHFHSAANKAKMAGGTPLSDADRKPWLAALAARLRSVDRPCVLACSALKRAYRDALREGDPLLRIVCLVLARDVVAARLAARSGHFMPASLLDSQFAAFEPPTPDECALIFDDARAAPADACAAVAGALRGASLHLRCRARSRYTVLRLPPRAPVPAFAAAGGPLLSVTRTRSELSLLVPTQRVPADFSAASAEGGLREDGWACLELVPPGGEGAAIPFDTVGVLLAIAQPLAAARVGLFALSTFNTDLVLIKALQLDVAAAALRGAGHAVELLDEDEA